jgi:drug/metabolite transporter (DMT)-like permease
MAQSLSYIVVVSLDLEAFMFIGILAGLTTCALWGLSFVAPRAIAPFSPWDLMVMRYVIFGVTCCLLMVNARFRPRGMSRSMVITGLLLGGAGYVGYFISIAYAVQLSGAAVPPLIVGTMPVFLAILANGRDRTFQWRQLAMPIGLISVGVAIVNVDALSNTNIVEFRSMLLGILLAIAALLIWIFYGLANASIMRRSDAPDGLHWTGLQGIGSAVVSLMLLPMTSFEVMETASSAQVWNFLGWSLVMGLLGAWFATWCWMVASKRLPLALSAQLIVAETLFGLAFGFIFEQRLPTVIEAGGAALQFAGVCMAIAAFSRRTGAGRVGPGHAA